MMYLLGGYVRNWAKLVLIACVAAAALGLAAPAFAYNEADPTAPGDINAANCGGCHNPYFSVGACIHGGYSTSSSKCQTCHTVHDGPDDSIMLLPGATIQATCFTCHDGTAGLGVYGAVAARGLAVGAVHRCETTNVVPGGNPVTGQESTMAFGGQGGTLSCDDCHSPHAASVVATFTSERNRFSGWMSRFPTNNLLKRRPGNSASSTAVYGSDWCGACHRGRLSGSGMANNHPVDSLASLPSPFYYERAAILSTVAPTSSTTTGTLGLSNRGYLMPWPRTAGQTGHSPICQQCHEDSRNVGTLDPSGAPADAATFTVTQGDGRPNGATSPDNPRFQNFPHESVNRRFLVEIEDDLCTNCHPTAILP